MRKYRGLWIALLLLLIAGSASAETIQETLARVRAKYGPSPTTDECGAIINETAYIHRNDPEQWGVNQKTAGNHAVRYDGQWIAADIIQNGVTKEAYDVLVAAGDGGSATPAWNYVGVITDPARPWVAPIPPQGNPPDPPPATDCLCKTEIAALAVKIDELSAQVAALGVALQQANEQAQARDAQLAALAKSARTFQFKFLGIGGQGIVTPIP